MNIIAGSLAYAYLWFQSNAIELVIYVPLLKSTRLTRGQRILFFSLCNAITHPIVFFGFMASPLPILPAILSAEVFAVVVETLLIRYYFPTPNRWPKILAVSLAANLASWQLAPILTWLAVRSTIIPLARSR